MLNRVYLYIPYILKVGSKSMLIFTYSYSNYRYLNRKNAEI